MRTQLHCRRIHKAHACCMWQWPEQHSHSTAKKLLATCRAHQLRSACAAELLLAWASGGNPCSACWRWSHNARAPRWRLYQLRQADPPYKSKAGGRGRSDVACPSRQPGTRARVMLDPQRGATATHIQALKNSSTSGRFVSNPAPMLQWARSIRSYTMHWSRHWQARALGTGPLRALTAALPSALHPGRTKKP